ncbi:MAG TPA: DUF4249 family protein [Tenuifilaceae bacterium]|nr:DUF4249 family protein [Tenuifilaceae bacterium]HPE17095.1 DUF4249 family protein [Tenuifilaceae bacterium]HPJ44821.1 DUF4249 family protein [Tenuifilaceae bacterium]HPQ32884.1 DUF4249 family protein [Tenuifilaceae bacterium]HRX67186.1 DUF4249 family protein [Tenuifilaceae bacterium]
MKNHKKYNIRIILFFILLPFVQQGCIEDVKDANLPSIEEKLVVSSFISPGDSIRVKVSKSTPIYYNQELSSWDDYYQPLTYASVFITNVITGNTKEIPFIPSKEYYLLTPAEFSIEKGGEYELTVSAAGLKSVKARTNVPFGTPEVHSLSIDTIYNETYNYEDGTSYGYNDLVISGYVADIPNENNFYTIGAHIIEDYYSPWEDTTYVYQYFQDGASFSDTDNDGKDIPFKSYLYLNGNSTYSLMLLSSDKHYYYYHKSYYNWDSGNPFSEPTPMYSNIDDGLGIFASVTYFNVYCP